jgi:hypothetical protein
LNDKTAVPTVTAPIVKDVKNFSRDRQKIFASVDFAASILVLTSSSTRQRKKQHAKRTTMLRLKIFRKNFHGD